MVDELQAVFLVEEDDTVAHVVEHGLQHFARELDVGARRRRLGPCPFGYVARGLGCLLGRGQRLLSFRQLRDEEHRCRRHLGDFVLPGDRDRGRPSLDLPPHVLLKNLQAGDHRALHVHEDRGAGGQAQE